MNQPATPHAPPIRRRRVFYGWYLVAGSVLNNGIIAGAYFQGFQAFFLPILHTMGWSYTAISGAFSLRQVESGILGPVVGLLVDRWGPRSLIIAGAVVTGVGLMGLSQTSNLLMFYIFFLITSIGTAASSHGVTWAVLITRWFVRRRGRAMGIATLGPLIGGLLVVVNTALVAEFGWRTVLFVYGWLVMVIGIGLGLLVRDRPERFGYLPDNAPQDTPQLQGAAEGRARAQRAADAETGLSASQVLRTRDFWVFSLFLSSAFVGTSAMMTHQLAYFRSEGLSTGAAATTVLLASVASGAGRMGAGALVDLMDYRYVLAGVTLALSLSFVYLALAPVTTLVQALPFAVIFGIGWGSTVPVRPVIAALTFGDRSIGAIIGLMQLSALLGGIMGPLIMGVIFDNTGSYHASLWVLAIISVMVLPLLFLMKPRSQLPLSPTR